ncbi:uncharacterized protein LOC109598440 isoform X2 [Aethina tumida]|uniref:uncharacterized protein LOC109598440 isoform X2 n=1 Tax=Aethina tumida TaxID=116153 RepID=UPI00096AEE12|nr:uncharacterized protein LOC109598440 isoform X2 [Aethina tumida]
MRSGLLLALVLVLGWEADATPLRAQDEEQFDRHLDKFVRVYYERFVKNQEPSDEGMQADQPVDQQADMPVKNQTQDDFLRAMRNSYRERDVDLRTKDNWIQLLKNKILINIGRGNASLLQTEETTLPLNITHLMSGFNSTTIDEDQITEKIRSFYPSCDVPQNTDHELWREEHVMNLYFNFDYNGDSNIATATLRLYRIPLENNTKTGVKNEDCDTSVSDEEKLIRVSIYWYTKSLKKPKRRLSDSKVISEASLWVELDVKQATKAWKKGRNLGLAVVVEDQDGNILKADKYFKGAICRVGASTPKPIPTIIVDAVRKNNEQSRLHDLSGNGTASAFHSDLQLLPIIDVCTLEFPENQSVLLASQIGSLRITACNLKKFHEQAEKIAEKERLERLVTLPIPSNRHIRHQRQHLANKQHQDVQEKNFDPRSRIVNSRILWTNEELQRLPLNFNQTNR